VAQGVSAEAAAHHVIHHDRAELPVFLTIVAVRTEPELNGWEAIVQRTAAIRGEAVPERPAIRAPFQLSGGSLPAIIVKSR